MDKEKFIYDESGDSLSKKDVVDLLNRQNKKIADLEAKLAESEDRIAKARRQAYSSRQMDNTLKIRRLADEITAKEKAITKLKQQLAEKDKESLKYFKEYRAWKEKCELLEQDQKQTAIAELNNILDTFAIFVNEEKESMVSPDGNGNLSLLEYIENRIDTLKGEK